VDSSFLSSHPSLQDQQTLLHSLGEGLPALPKCTLERIWADEYVDFSDLPPARAKAILSAQQLADRNILLVQLQEGPSTCKLILDFSTWVQCFAVYTVAVVIHNPDRLPNLLAYLLQTVKNAHKFK